MASIVLEHPVPLDNGRNFLKDKLPHLIVETDEEW
jgi:hypothetical protein